MPQFNRANSNLKGREGCFWIIVLLPFRLLTKAVRLLDKAGFWKWLKVELSHVFDGMTPQIAGKACVILLSYLAAALLLTCLANWYADWNADRNAEKLRVQQVAEIRFKANERAEKLKMLIKNRAEREVTKDIDVQPAETRRTPPPVSAPLRDLPVLRAIPLTDDEMAAFTQEAAQPDALKQLPKVSIPPSSSHLAIAGSGG